MLRGRFKFNSGTSGPASEHATLGEGLKNLTLRSKIQLLFVLLMCLMGVTVVCSFALLGGQHVDNQIKRDSEAATRLLTSLLAERRHSLLASARLIAQVPSLRQQPSDQGLESMAKSFRKQVNADKLAFLAKDGRLQSADDALMQATQSLALQTAVKHALAGQEWSGVIVSDGTIMLTAIAPIRGDDNLAAVIALESLGQSMAKQLSDGTNAEVAFMVGDDVVAASMKIGSKLGRVADAWTVVDIADSEYVARYTTFPGTRAEQQIGFVSLRSLDAIKAPYHDLTVAFAALLVIAIAVATALTRTFSKGLTKPLEDTVQAALHVRDGQWPEPLEVVRQDEIGVLQSVFNDMTGSMRRSHERLMSLIDTDPLTELDNHRRFKERLDQEVFRALLAHEPLSLALVDIDRFSEYNDRHGFAAGDDALQQLSALLREVAPKPAFLARYGGEEFAIIMPGASAGLAEDVAGRLRNLVTVRLKAAFTLSIGISELVDGISTGAALQLSAELALGRAKQLGKDRVCRFESVPGADQTEDPFQLQKFLEDTTFATIQALAAAVDAKDPYTQGHSSRVAKYASDLARYVGSAAEEVDLVYRTGTLHDVGKIGVPDSVLKKPTQLDPEEQRIMETHPVLGEIIVKRAPQLEEMLPGVRSHHERWDGKGYPDRLMGAEIPRLARFIAVADAFDAMTSDRPYRRGMSFEQALNEVERGAGSQFEPSLAFSFVRMMRLQGTTAKAA